MAQNSWFFLGYVFRTRKFILIFQKHNTKCSRTKLRLNLNRSISKQIQLGTRGWIRVGERVMSICGYSRPVDCDSGKTYRDTVSAVLEQSRTEQNKISNGGSGGGNSKAAKLEPATKRPKTLAFITCCLFTKIRLPNPSIVRAVIARHSKPTICCFLTRLGFYRSALPGKYSQFSDPLFFFSVIPPISPPSPPMRMGPNNAHGKT